LDNKSIKTNHGREY